MISTAEFYGGAVDIGTSVSTYTLPTKESARVIRASWTTGSGHTITLPTTVVGDMTTTPQEAGGPTFYVINNGTTSVDVIYTKASGSVTLATLTAGKALLVLSYPRNGTYLGLNLDVAT